jgi:hypothetical protein
MSVVDRNAVTVCLIDSGDVPRIGGAEDAAIGPGQRGKLGLEIRQY